jgi:hypothetical protein
MNSSVGEDFTSSAISKSHGLIISSLLQHQPSLKGTLLYNQEARTERGDWIKATGKRPDDPSGTGCVTWGEI